MAIEAQVSPQGQSLPYTGNDLLALSSGRPIAGKVVALLPQGLTQLLIGRDSLKIALPVQILPGTSVTVQLLGAGTQSPQLVVTPQTSGAVVSNPSSPQPAGQAGQVPVATSAVLPSAPAGAPASVPVASAVAAETAWTAQLQSSDTGRPVPASPSSLAVLAAQVTRQMAQVSGNASANVPGNPGAGIPGLVPQAASPVLPAMPAASQPVPLTPLEALTQLAPILANLSGAQSRLSQMPPMIAAAIRQVLATPLDMTDAAPTADKIRQALQSAGLGVRAAETAGQTSQARQLSSLLDADLPELLQMLRTWLGEVPAPRRVVPRPGTMSDAAARAGHTRASLSQAEMVADSEPVEVVGRHLLRVLGETADGLVHRVAPSPMEGRSHEPSGLLRQEWTGAIPLMLGSEASIAQFQVSHEGPPNGGEDAASWHVRFTLNFSVLGEVGAHVILRGHRLSSLIWSDREETARVMEEALPELRIALEALGVEPASLICRVGVPRTASGTAGDYLDSTR